MQCLSISASSHCLHALNTTSNQKFPPFTTQILTSYIMDLILPISIFSHYISVSTTTSLHPCSLFDHQPIFHRFVSICQSAIVISQQTFAKKKNSKNFCKIFNKKWHHHHTVCNLEEAIKPLKIIRIFSQQKRARARSFWNDKHISFFLFILRCSFKDLHIVTS